LFSGVSVVCIGLAVAVVVGWYRHVQRKKGTKEDENGKKGEYGVVKEGVPKNVKKAKEKKKPKKKTKSGSRERPSVSNRSGSNRSESNRSESNRSGSNRSESNRSDSVNRSENNRTGRRKRRKRNSASGSQRDSRRDSRIASQSHSRSGSQSHSQYSDDVDAALEEEGAFEAAETDRLLTSQLSNSESEATEAEAEQDGDAENVEGNADESVEGNADESVDGNADENVEGNADENVEGNADENVEGNADENVDGERRTEESPVIHRGGAGEEETNMKTKIETNITPDTKSGDRVSAEGGGDRVSAEGGRNSCLSRAGTDVNDNSENLSTKKSRVARRIVNEQREVSLSVVLGNGMHITIENGAAPLMGNGFDNGCPDKLEAGQCRQSGDAESHHHQGSEVSIGGNCSGQSENQLESEVGNKGRRSGVQSSRQSSVQSSAESNWSTEAVRRSTACDSSQTLHHLASTHSLCSDMHGNGSAQGPHGLPHSRISILRFPASERDKSKTQSARRLSAVSGLHSNSIAGNSIAINSIAPKSLNSNLKSSTSDWPSKSSLRSCSDDTAHDSRFFTSQWNPGSMSSKSGSGYHNNYDASKTTER
jgi:hypothetical protein